MKTLLQFICLVYGGICFSQPPPTVSPPAVTPSVSTQDLSKLTIGFGPGISYNISDKYEYSLSTDPVPILRSQKLSNLNFVISSVVVFRFGNPRINSTTKNFAALTTTPTRVQKIVNRATLNLSINMLELSSDNLAFNKTIDGGLGVGYYFSPIVQAALFFEISRYRQLREYVVEEYSLKPVPNGNDFYNALDADETRLFYTTTSFSLSLKVVVTIPNTVN